MPDPATASDTYTLSSAVAKFMFRLVLYPLALMCVFIVVPVAFTKIWFKRDA